MVHIPQRFKYLEIIGILAVLLLTGYILYTHAQDTTYVVRTTPTPTTTQTTAVTDTDKGKTIQVAVGQTIVLTLHSLYWQDIASSNEQILKEQSSISSPDTSVRIPGTGAGTITTTFTAIAQGEAVVSASRTSCGEAMACTVDNSTYSVTIHVSK